MTDKLLEDIQSSIMNMQSQMQNTYQNLASVTVYGESTDKTVRITMTATYAFQDIEFNEKALQGGINAFKTRIREAWEDVVKKIQEATQAKTLELLKEMQIPEEIRNMSMPAAQGALEKDKSDDEK